MDVEDIEDVEDVEDEGRCEEEKEYVRVYGEERLLKYNLDNILLRFCQICFIRFIPSALESCCMDRNNNVTSLCSYSPFFLFCLACL